MFVKLEQSANAQSPILVTLLGIIVFPQPKINVFESVSIIALHPFRESYFVFPGSTTMLVKLEQNKNAWLPIFVTLLGI